MDRRTFLKSVGVLAGAAGGGSLLAACGDGTTTAGGDGDGGQGIPEGEPSLNVIVASFETLTGEDRRIGFGVTTFDNEPVKSEDVQVYLREVNGPVITGPHAAEFHDEGGSPLGVYVATLDFAEPGHKELVAVTDGRYGTKALNVVAPADSQVPVPGQPAIAVATPTTADPLGVAELCTLDPPCGMHDVSLDQALGEGRPVVLLFATPAYCQTAICGPSVSTVDAVRQEVDAPQIAFVHVEIFADGPPNVTDAVQAWGLPSEPWLFTIGSDGTIVDRLDGPMVSDIVTDMVGQLTGTA